MSAALFLSLLVPLCAARAAESATGSITLTWDACATNVAGYVIHHGPVGGNVTNSTLVDSCTTSTVLSNLTAGCTHFFFVTAYDAQSVESDPSNIIFDTPPLPPGTNPVVVVTNPPSALVLTATVGTAPESVLLSWTANADPSAIGFIINFGVVGGGVTNLFSVEQTNSATLENLQGGTPHFFFVTPYDSRYRRGTPSAMVTATPLIVPAPATNSAPVLPPVGNKTVAAGTPLSFKLTATDSDKPVQTLTFSLASGALAGATLDPNNGAFSWTPARALGGTTHLVTFRVTDNGSPALSATQTVAITVTRVSAPPAPVLNGSIPPAAGAVALNWTTGGDPFVADYVLRYGLAGGTTNTLALTGTSVTLTNLPVGAACFFFLTARNDLNMESLPSNVLPLTPAPAANTPPHLTPVGNKTVTAGTVLSFKLAASDAESPAQSLTFSLASSTLAGVSLNPASGVFTWAPPYSLGGTTNYFTFRVTDNGSPTLSDTQTIAIIVNPAPLPPTPTLSAVPGAEPQSVLLSWSASAGTNLFGCIISYGAVGGNATNVFSVDFTNRVTVDGLLGGVPHFFFVMLHDDLLRHGLPSEVVTATPAAPLPSATNTTPALAPIGNKTVLAGQCLSFVATARDADVPTQALTFTLGADAPAGASLESVSGRFTWTPGTTLAGTTHRFTIQVTDNGTPALSTVRTITVTVTAPTLPPSATSVELRAVLSGTRLLNLTWTCGDTNTEAFRIERSLDGAAFTPIATTRADARSYAVPESEVTYAFAYPYVFRVCALHGGQPLHLSNPACALTNLADLIVTSVRTVPTFPVAGQPVVFKATIQNNGAVATPQGRNARVAFYVNGGQAVAWADNMDILWPGQSTTVTASAGPNNTNTWTALAGKLTATAIVDDAAQVEEEDENNNRLNTRLVIAPADAPVVSVTIDQPILAEGGTNTVTFTFTRTGSTTADLPVHVHISGTARDGGDYNYLSNVVVIPAHSASLALTVTATDDLLIESKESLTLALVPALTYQVGDDNSATLFIQDNDKRTSGSNNAAAARSAFKTVSARPDAAGQMVIAWASQAGATYRIFAREPLSETGWTEVSSAITATTSVTRWTNPLPDAATSYAIALVQ